MCTCLLDDEAKTSLRISLAIDRELSQFKKETAREFKLLLLGGFILRGGRLLIIRREGANRITCICLPIPIKLVLFQGPVVSQCTEPVADCRELIRD